MQRKVLVEGISAPIIIARRKGTRSIRLSIKSDGNVRLTIPYGVSEAVALRFLRDKQDWISKHQKPQVILTDGMRLGKSHTLRILDDQTAQKPRTRLKDNLAQIIKPPQLLDTDPSVQQSARKLAEKVLAIEASRLLPQRLEALAKQHNVAYASVTTKKLRSRWGSCDQQDNIVLNNYLMQLDWRLIDYVLIHELAHVTHAHHQASFWQTVEKMLPDWKERRREIKAMRTTVLPTKL